ncbi:MAG TPA: hypothetical protein ENI29_03795 [bacterium]|nr:hypothetical protein [bacterium]
MSIESKLAGINIYYSTNVTFILETVISTMQFWGYNTTGMEDGSIKAIQDRSRRFLFQPQESKQEILTENKLEKINYQINQKPETIKNHILKMGLIYFFSLFEAFNKDYFQELYLFKPDLMKSKERKVDLEYLLQFENIEDLHRSLSQDQIERFGHQDIDEFAKLILKKFNIDLKGNLECWPNLRESYYRRNIIVHNDGKISELYLKKLSLGNDKLNEELDCNIESLWKCHSDIHSYMDFIDDAIRKKFNLKSLIEYL